MAKDGTVDWAFGEALAFGTLVLEGTPVRLSGQDSGRGTFSQRHLAFYDSKTGKRYIPLQHMARRDQARFDVFDSSLSEYARAGFRVRLQRGRSADAGDLGSAVRRFRQRRADHDRPVHLLGGTKWGQPSGLVMLLPHGYEGQGPEHSSARIERFLHAVRREQYAGVQLHHAGAVLPPAAAPDVRRSDRRGMRKPLVIFTPKSLLRSPGAVSSFNELTGSVVPAGDRRYARSFARSQSRVLHGQGLLRSGCRARCEEVEDVAIVCRRSRCRAALVLGVLDGVLGDLDRVADAVAGLRARRPRRRRARRRR